jgi:hypothetical protein
MEIRLRPTALVLLAACVFAMSISNGLSAAATREARLTQVIKDVQLLPANASPRSASLNEIVRAGTAVQTGVESRAELTFADQTIARLGAETVFSFDAESRTSDLASGAILMQVPKSSSGAQIKTAAVTGAIAGTTLLLEYHPDAYIKCILLQGAGRFCLKRRHRVNDCLVLHAGEMLILNPNAKSLPDAVDVDLERLLKTCQLITDFPVLPKQDLLVKAANDQRHRKSKGTFTDTNLVIFGRGTLVNLVDPNAPKTSSATTTVSPTPTPTPSSNSQSPP